MPGSPDHRAPHQEHRALERRGDGRARPTRPKKASAVTSRRLRRRRRSTKSASTISSAVTTAATPTSSSSRVTRRPASTPARISRAGSTRRDLENFRRELRDRRRPVVLSASVADAGLLGIPDGVDGPRPDHGDLPGALHALPGGSRLKDRVEREGLGVSRRRRDRRAGIARRDHRCPRARSSTTSSSSSTATCSGSTVRCAATARSSRSSRRRSAAPAGTSSRCCGAASGIRCSPRIATACS